MDDRVPAAFVRELGELRATHLTMIDRIPALAACVASPYLVELLGRYYNESQAQLGRLIDVLSYLEIPAAQIRVYESDPLLRGEADVYAQPSRPCDDIAIAFFLRQAKQAEIEIYGDLYYTAEQQGLGDDVRELLGRTLQEDYSLEEVLTGFLEDDEIPDDLPTAAAPSPEAQLYFSRSGKRFAKRKARAG